nr:MAG TPA: hypothetical protein [Caudoviricetes sp.]
MVLSSCCTSNQIPLSSYRLVSQPNCHVCISSAPCRWNLPALTSPTYSKTEIVKIKLLRLTIAGRMFDRFKNILFLSYHRLSRLSPKNAKRLLPCVLIRNQFSDLFFVVFKAMPGIEPKSLKIHRRENHFTPVIAKTRPKPRKNKINIKETSMNGTEEGTRTLNAFTTP